MSRKFFLHFLTIIVIITITWTVTRKFGYTNPSSPSMVAGNDLGVTTTPGRSNRPFPNPVWEVAENYVEQKCEEYDSNVYLTECAINLLDRTAAEREWKQRKIEAAKRGKFNPDTFLVKEGQKLIKDWRQNFENYRDAWCESSNAFMIGSGIPFNTAVCKLGLELVALDDLNNVYYHSLIEANLNSNSIPDFEPTSTDLDALVKTNITKRGCVWYGETNCD